MLLFALEKDYSADTVGNRVGRWREAGKPVRRLTSRWDRTRAWRRTVAAGMERTQLDTPRDGIAWRWGSRRATG